MKKFISLLLFTSLATFSFGQTEKLNQFDDKGKKDGKWKVYLNRRWREVKDSTKAFYYWYTWYDHGANTNQFGYRFKRSFKLEPNGNNIQRGKPELLDGEYKWADPNGKTHADFVLKKGEFISEKVFYKTGELAYSADHTKKWKGQPHTFCMYEYNKAGKATIYYQRWNEGVWLGWGEDFDSINVDTLKVTGDSAYVISRYYKSRELRTQADEILVHLSNLRTQTILHGNCASYEGGQKWEGHYRYGKLNGEIKSYYANGQLKENGSYSAGKKIGEWKWWDQDGKLKKIENYK